MMPDLSPEAWAVVGIGVTTVGTVIAAHLSTRSSVRAARSAAEEARDLSRPTGNGFAADVREALDDMGAAVARIERRLEAEAVSSRKTQELLAGHLSDHARASIGGGR